MSRNKTPESRMRDQTDAHRAKTHRNDNILICTCSTPAAHYKIKLSHKKYTRAFAEMYAPTSANACLSIAIAITPLLRNQLNISIRTHQSRGSKQSPAGTSSPTRYGTHYVALLYEKRLQKHDPSNNWRLDRFPGKTS